MSDRDVFSVFPIDVKTSPFPHAVVHRWWPRELLEEVLEEFKVAEKQSSLWKHFSGTNEEKYEGGPHLFGEATRSLVRLIEATGPRLSEIFDLPHLSMELVGGGYHRIEPGGLLNVHSDFSVSPDTDRYRRVNLLIYLNPTWFDSDGGFLELWNDEGPEVKIKPTLNTTAMFVTSSTSWHGHPVPVVEGRVRRSFAAYFYSDEPPPDFTDQSTVWHPRAPLL